MQKRMDSVYVELDDVKAELEKLRTEYKSKAELSENLRKAHNEQLSKNQEACLKIEKQAQELSENAEKISMAQQMCEDLKCSLKDKESMIQNLRAANDRLRVDCDEKYRKLEEANRVLGLALEEANEKKMDEEQTIRAYKEEIQGLKARLSDSQTKCLEAEKKANASKELRERDEVMFRVEEESRKVQDQLKWKKEQFRHLEEAHEKLKDQFKESKKEWEGEKSSLLDEICSLQTNLESQTRLSSDLQKRLQMCNQALAHEESRRKRLEAQVSDFQTRFTSDFSDSEDAKSQLSAERDKEIASLRQSLSTKAALHKEMEYQARRLQQENEELRMSLKELQEAQIQSAPGSPSLAKLRSKLKRLEQMHRDSVADHKAKEAEWSSQLEKMTGDLNIHKSELENKDAAIAGLRLELEQMQRDLTSNLRAKEYECSSHLEKMRKELNICKCEIESKDAALKELNMEVELMRRACTTNGAEDAEWSSQLEKMADDVKSYVYELERKDATIAELKMEMEQRDSAAVNELKMELETCHTLTVQLKMQNEEIKMELEACHSQTVQLKMQNDVMVLVLKLGISEAQLKISSEQSEMVLHDKAKEEYISLLMQQVEMKNAALVIAQAGIEEEREKAAFLSRRIEALDLIEKEQLLMQEELDRYKELLEDSSKHELCLKQQLFQIEGVLEIERREVNDALERANAELAEKISEGNEIEMELLIWKSITENLRTDLEVSLGVRKELEASLLAEVDVGDTFKQENKGLLRVLEEKEKAVENLQQQIVLLEQKFKRTDADAENAGSAEIEAAMSLEKLQSEVSRLEQESLMRDFNGVLLAQISAERLFEHEKEKLIQLVEEKYQRVNHLMQVVESSEHKFNCSVASFSSQLAEKQAEINLINEAWEDITAAQVMAAVENEEKKSVIAELEDEVCSLQTKLESQQKSLSDSQQRALEIEAELKTRELEVQILSDKMKSQLRSSDALIEELKSERRNVLEDVIKLSTENISHFSSTDKQLRGMLEEMVFSFGNHGPEMELELTDELVDSEKENVSTPTTMKKCEVISDIRSPFRDLNT